MTVPSRVPEGIPLTLLIVEDSEDDLRLLLRELQRGGYAVHHRLVQTPAALDAALAEAADWQLVISDFSLPAMTGFDVVRTVHRAHPHLPCIVISGTITEDAAVEVLRAGARDFIVKERMARLVPAIRRELQEARERSRRREAEENLRETRERMQFVLDSVGIGTWSVDARAGTALWSEVMERLHGLTPGTFAGHREALDALVHPDDRERVAQWLEQLARDHRDWRVEYRTTWPDGSVHWILSIGRVAWDPRGQTSRAVGVSMDVTAQKELEQQVQQAQKMESIGSLAGGIAHDFNNLLTVISGFAELAAERTVDPAVVEPLREIGHAAASATALTRQLLTFSRRQIVKPRLLDLGEHIRGFGKILRRMVEEHVHLDFRLTAGLPLVRADAGQVEQVLLNLVANARDAMPSGGTVTIQTECVPVRRGAGGSPNLPEGMYVVLSVADTGTGMSPDVQVRLFDPFFTTKPPGHGTGLGLATVYGIVKQSGGEITLQSEIGSGSLFRIYLPAAVAPDPKTAAQERADALALAGTETILVVEDNAALRRLAQRVLTRYGYRVLAAQNGAEARTLCTTYAGPIHAVLVDIIMPGESGPTVAAWVERQRPGLGVVYMSGYAGGHGGAALSGEEVFLHKPFTSVQLVKAVRQVLPGPGSGAA